MSAERNIVTLDNDDKHKAGQVAHYSLFLLTLISSPCRLVCKAYDTTAVCYADARYK